MTANYIIYLDVTTGDWLTALNNPMQIDPGSLRLFLGDCPAFKIYLVEPLQTQQATQNNFQIVNTAGLTIGMFLDNGETGNPQQVYAQYPTGGANWLTDANNQYFYTDPNTAPFGFPLNTPALIALFAANDTGQVYMDIAVYQNGVQWTVFHKQVTVTVGAPVFNVFAPAPLTALSLEQARALFVPIVGLPGQGFYLQSPTGKKIFVSATDNADGTASFSAPESN